MRSKQTVNDRLETNARSKHPSDNGVDGEFLQLTSQLSAEANQLAMVYPPKPQGLESCRETRSAVAPRRRRWRRRVKMACWITTCAGVLLAVGLGIHPLCSAPDASEKTVQSPVPPHAGATASKHPGPTPETTPTISPVMFVSELSDPEFEAWLDLREDDAPERIAF